MGGLSINTKYMKSNLLGGDKAYKLIHVSFNINIKNPVLFNNSNGFLDIEESDISEPESESEEETI